MVFYKKDGSTNGYNIDFQGLQSQLNISCEP
jgi:hypothetical protein